jgi:hypothetical protein
LKEETVSASTYCPSATDLATLAEAARVAAARYDRERSRLADLDAVSQQEAAVQAALAAKDNAERDLVNAQLAAERQSAEAARLQRLETIDTALLAKSAEIGIMQRELATLPKKLARLQHEHSALLAQRTRI